MQDYSASPSDSTKDFALKGLIRASIEKYALKVAHNDPLATEKIKVTRYLKRFDLTPDVLPADFWTLDENRRGFELGEIVGPVRRAAKRLKRMMARGYPADYYSRSDKDQRRTSAAVRQRRRRAKAAKPAPTPRGPRRIAFERVSREWRDDRLASLTAWTAGSGPSQRHLRGHERELVKAALAYHALTAQLGHAPSYGELADKIDCTRYAARNLVRRLESLYGITGPWRSKKRDRVCQVKPCHGVSG